MVLCLLPTLQFESKHNFSHLHKTHGFESQTWDSAMLLENLRGELFTSSLKIRKTKKD